MQISEEFCFGKPFILISTVEYVLCTCVEHIYIIEVMKAADKSTVKKISYVRWF
jgi:hypothetical protein